MAREHSYNILLKPVVTEKAAHLAETGKYIFQVADGANKISVASAVKAIYGVDPVAVNIIKVKGKEVTRGRIVGRRKDWKKAVVTLPAGKSIQIYEGV
jgi:large subunit ribosomal protein L23